MMLTRFRKKDSCGTRSSNLSLSKCLSGRLPRTNSKSESRLKSWLFKTHKSYSCSKLKIK
jgi:hypothetical protein